MTDKPIPKKGEWMLCGDILFCVAMRTRLKDEHGDVIDVVLRDNDDVDEANSFNLSECEPVKKDTMLKFERFRVSFEGKLFEVQPEKDGLKLMFGDIIHEVKLLSPDELAFKAARDLAMMFSGRMVTEEVEAA